MNDLLQFPYISRPTVSQQHLLCRFVKIQDLFPEQSARLLPEKIRQRQYILQAIMQCRYGDGKILKAIKQVLPETLFRNSLLQILIGGRNDAHIHQPVPLSAYRTIPPFLHGTQQHPLRFYRKVLHLIHEQGASLRFLKISCLFLCGSGKRPLDMAEKGGRCQLFGQTAAIDRYIRLAGSEALPVNLFARCSFPVPVLPNISTVISVGATM